MYICTYVYICKFLCVYICKFKISCHFISSYLHIHFPRKRTISYLTLCFCHTWEIKNDSIIPFNIQSILHFSKSSQFIYFIVCFFRNGYPTKVDLCNLWFCLLIVSFRKKIPLPYIFFFHYIHFLKNSGQAICLFFQFCIYMIVFSWWCLTCSFITPISYKLESRFRS